MVFLVLRDLWRTYCNTERTRHQNYGAEGGLLTFYSVFAKRGSNEFFTVWCLRGSENDEYHGYMHHYASDAEGDFQKQLRIDIETA